MGRALLLAATLALIFGWRWADLPARDFAMRTMILSVVGAAFIVFTAQSLRWTS